MDDFFHLSKNLGFWVFLVHPTVVISATIRIGQEMLCLLYAGFFLPLPGCVALPQMGYENRVLVRLRQIGATDLTVALQSQYLDIFNLFVTFRDNTLFSFYV